jgi:hypothetical protein
VYLVSDHLHGLTDNLTTVDKELGHQSWIGKHILYIEQGRMSSSIQLYVL